MVGEGEQPAPAQQEAKPGTPNLTEGSFLFQSPQEKGAAMVHNINGELTVSMVAPMEAGFTGGKKVTIEGAGGITKDVLDIVFAALSPKNTEGVALTHLQLDRETISNLIAVAAEQGILSKSTSKPDSKWAPGGKMDQMTQLGIKLMGQMDQLGK